MLSLPEQGSNIPMQANHHSRALPYAMLKHTSQWPPPRNALKRIEAETTNKCTQACPDRHVT